jgi:hypothetical protein
MKNEEVELSYNLNGFQVVIKPRIKSFSQEITIHDVD